MESLVLNHSQEPRKLSVKQQALKVVRYFLLKFKRRTHRFLIHYGESMSYYPEGVDISHIYFV